MKEGGPLYIVFSGHICTGKDSIIKVLQERGKIQAMLGPIASLHILSEAVNHDADVLGGYYSNMADTTEFFELGTLCFRSVLSSSIQKKRGVVIGNRHAIEARQTFVEHSRVLKKKDQRYFDETATGVYDMLLRRAMEKAVLPIPDIVFFLFVDDIDILVHRNRKRNAPGEKRISEDYICSVAPYFEKYRRNFQQVYDFWGVPAPRLVEINTSSDMKNDEQRLHAIAEQVEQEIQKAYATRKRSIFDFTKGNAV